MSQSAGVKCLDRYGFPLAGLTAAEQAVRSEAAARENKLYDKWSRQVRLLSVRQCKLMPTMLNFDSQTFSSLMDGTGFQH